MKKEKPMGLLLNGSIRSAGVTFYLKQGQMIVRASRSMEKRSCTRQQFIQRQRMRHSIALWQALKPCQPMFTQSKTSYGNFVMLANRMPAVYVPCKGELEGASFLMPGMPVSDGSLPPVGQHLVELPLLSPADCSPQAGEQRGTAALMTDLEAGELRRGESLLLYTAGQRIEGRTPRVRFQRVREVKEAEMVVVEGRLALVGEEFGNAMKGWALVRVEGARCSTQCLVTRCSLYERYTTEEALQQAAASYGGLT